MNKKILPLLLAPCFTNAAADTWSPPIGIPVPEFGIEESHTMYSGNAAYKTGTDGPYSIYVDNTASNCSNMGPATAAKPRCDIPSDIDKPGTVVEIHGGPYEFNMSKPVFEVNGSKEKPVFIRGIDDGNGYPVIYNASTIGFQGQYFIMEQLIFEKSALRSGAKGASKYGRNHIAMRNLEVRNHPLKNGSAIVGTDVVFYKNHVHHNQGDDRHGTTVAPGSERVWIIDNYFHHNGGDAIQFCHRCKKAPPRNIYIGRNLMHSDRENGIDLKFGKDIVISENTIYGYRRARPDEEWCFDDNSYCGTFSSGSDGSAIVVGSDGAPGRPWIVANNIFDSTQGIRIEEVREAWIIGNNIHNIGQNVIALQKWGEALHIIGNTMHGAKFGINQYWRDKFTLHVSGNIMSSISDEFLSVKHVVSDRSTLEDNLMWNGDDNVQLRWGRRYKEKPTEVASAVEFGGSRNFVGDPQITRVDAKNISVSGGAETAAIRKKRLLEVDQKFKSIYGEDMSIVDAAD
ncbi:MAG: right-handed parallel beta-helix repeat-containing protein [Gammaproteobacteria bacterium]|nr:right-handed parallel beta-helix repeat-containing protein [Gammaproteobacteria bacterium]